MHFGLEAALTGESPGQVFQNGNIPQHVRLYQKSPKFLPSIRKKVTITFVIHISFPDAIHKFLSQIAE